MVKVFVIEEHNEAYFVWKYSAQKGYINSLNNTLLHLDEHADMVAPRINDFNQSKKGLRSILEFTYRELNIASFIVPAIFEGFFDKVYWVKQRHNKRQLKGQSLYVRSHGENDKKLITHRTELLERFTESNLKPVSISAKFYKYYKVHMQDVGKLNAPCLDIDLDYFSCCQEPTCKGLEIEITKREYDKFEKSPYHRLRFFDMGRVESSRKKSRYYFKINNFKFKDVSPLKVDKRMIGARIDEMAKVLQAKEIRPRIVTICRSRFSGYTPSDQYVFIESRLLKVLGKLYGNLEVVHIEELKKLLAK